ncbi:hypothetical protein Glove_180g84 [Diversispora epigaea]|uniref:Ammonium transporter AmtB-like domain-containing protein n=1 Tax=Diversispora epigaea TaxID=1348612 RepID=A0A397IW97_9GLOM|nr:hypothetical protein Glove_180g84 [Diversispora epigaea]
MSNDTSSTPDVPETASSGDVAWVLASTALVWIMIPGVGYFYSGMARKKMHVIDIPGDAPHIIHANWVRTN